MIKIKQKVSVRFLENINGKMRKISVWLIVTVFELWGIISTSKIVYYIQEHNLENLG